MSAVLLLLALSQVERAGVEPDAGAPHMAAPVPQPIPPPLSPEPSAAPVPPPAGQPYELPPPPPPRAPNAPPDAGTAAPATSGSALMLGGGVEVGFTLFPTGNPVDLLFFARPLLSFSAGEDFGMELGATFNLRAIDDVPLDRPNDLGGVLRREDWDESSDFGQIIRAVRVGKLDSAVWARAGAMRLKTLGQGHVVSRYSNQDNPNYHPAAASAGLSLGPFKSEFFASDILGARLFAGLAALELGRLFSNDVGWHDRFWLSFELAHDAGLAGGRTPTATLLDLDFNAILYRASNARVQALVSAGSRVGARADFGALLGLSAEADLSGFLLGGKLEVRKQAGSYRQGFFGPQYELSRFSGAGFDGVPQADQLLPDSGSVYSELRIGSPKLIVLEAALEYFFWGRADLDTSLQLELLESRLLASARFHALALGVRPRYAVSAEARLRIFKSFYALGAGGTMFLPQADGTLHRGWFASLGVGLDFEVALTP